MVSQVCLDKIAAMPPPLNVPCPNICADANFINNTHCSAMGMPVDSPFITRDPSFGPNGGYCYCCCSCFTRDTPIEKSPGSFVMVQDIEAGDTIMAAGADLEWKPTKVKSRSGSTSSAAIGGLYLVFYQMENEEEPRQVLVTPGHLFLLAESRTLKPVQFLAPGDMLAQADGGAARVILGVSSDQPIPTAIHTLSMEGEYDGSDLTGRLVNTHGLVSADFEVQARFEAEQELLDSGAEPEIGSKEYIALHHSDETVDQLSAMLPKAFAFETGDGMIRVPNAAQRYLSDAQADHLAATASFSPLGNAGPRIAAQRVIALARTLFSDVFFVIDWRDPTPNAYAFVDGGQKMVVINGGYLRLEQVYSELGLLTVIAMAARLDGKPCVCDADYYAYAYGLREMVTDTTFVDIITRALTQASALFAPIAKIDEAADDPCHEPGVECRQLTIQNALSFQGVPPCGQTPTNLELVRATTSGDGSQIDVVFSEPVERSSATTVSNYSLLPHASVSQATLDPSNPARVSLTVERAAGTDRELLTVERVSSRDNLPLPPGGAHIVVQRA